MGHRIRVVSLFFEIDVYYELSDAVSLQDLKFCYFCYRLMVNKLLALFQYLKCIFGGGEPLFKEVTSLAETFVCDEQGRHGYEAFICLLQLSLIRC